MHLYTKLLSKKSMKHCLNYPRFTYEIKKFLLSKSIMAYSVQNATIYRHLCQCYSYHS